MKVFLFLVFFAFTANAQTYDVTGMSLASYYIRTYAPSAYTDLNQVHSEISQYCVQNNVEKCEELGYTETSCPSDKVACPFDPTLFSCVRWSCEDLGLFAARPDNMECEAVQNQTIICYKCQCGIGYIDPHGCDGLVETLTTDKTICADLGYKQSITDCANYLPCPADANKVRCLDNVGCTESKVTGCIARYEVPDNANAIIEEVPCDCGGTKEVVTGWTCKTGYNQEGSSCVGITCAADEFVGPATSDPSSVSYKIEECYEQSGNTSPGWEKVATTHTGAVQCYRCQCNLPSNCIYSETTKGEFGKLEEQCCDKSSYVKCVRDCPKNKRVPATGAVADLKICNACGEETEYIDDWHCKEGYQRRDNLCDIVECPKPSNGSYYSLDYQQESDCTSRIRPGEGWVFTQQGQKSGEEWCGLCKCPYDENDPQYHYTTADTDSMGDAKLSGLGCNGKYKECEILNTSYVTQLPDNVAQSQEIRICGKKFYKLKSCEPGYVLSLGDTKCLPEKCDGYNITGGCPTWGDCSMCNSQGTIKYKLLNCRDDVAHNVEYKMNATQTDCCQKTCDTYDHEFFIGETCPEGKTLVEQKVNGCGDRCIKCM